MIDPKRLLKIFSRLSEARGADGWAKLYREDVGALLEALDLRENAAEPPAPPKNSLSRARIEVTVREEDPDGSFLVELDTHGGGCVLAAVGAALISKSDEDEDSADLHVVVEEDLERGAAEDLGTVVSFETVAAGIVRAVVPTWMLVEDPDPPKEEPKPPVRKAWIRVELEVEKGDLWRATLPHLGTPGDPALSEATIVVRWDRVAHPVRSSALGVWRGFLPASVLEEAPELCSARIELEAKWGVYRFWVDPSRLEDEPFPADVVAKEGADLFLRCHRREDAGPGTSRVWFEIWDGREASRVVSNSLVRTNPLCVEVEKVWQSGGARGRRFVTVKFDGPSGPSVVATWPEKLSRLQPSMRRFEK